MTPAKVLLLRGTGNYGALRFFIDDIAVAFRERGIETVIADIETLTTHQDLADFLAKVQPVDFAFSFFVFGDYANPLGQSIGDLVKAPFIVQHLDYPFVHEENLSATSRSTAVLVVDPSHVDAIRDIYGPDHFAHVGFVPHAALGEPFPIQPDAEKFAAERPIPILFTGTYYPAAEPPWASYPSEIKAVFEDAAELALSREWIAALDALDATLKSHGIDPKSSGSKEERQSLRQVRLLATQINEWVRSTRRVKFFEAAARVDLPLTVYGRGFDIAAEKFRNLTFKGSVELSEIIGLMRKSRVVMNINANFGRGAHDRVFTAMTAGAAAASDLSSFYADHFINGRDIFLYRWKKLDNDLGALRNLAADPQALFSMAKAGQDKALKHHRWTNRIDDILKVADRLRNSA